MVLRASEVSVVAPGPPSPESGPPSAGGPNGPGCGGGVAVGSRKVELKVGDVLIVPPGVIHGWFDIPDHVDYLSFRPSHGVMKNGWVNPTIATK